MKILAAELRSSRRFTLLVVYEALDGHGNKDVYGNDAWKDAQEVFASPGEQFSLHGLGYTRGISFADAKQLLKAGMKQYKGKPDAIVLIGLDKDVITFGRAKQKSPLRSVNFYIPNFKSSLVTGKLCTLFLGSRLLVGFYHSDSDWFTQQFVDRYFRSFNIEPTPLAAAGYDSASAIIQALKELSCVVRFRESAASLATRREYIREWVEGVAFQGVAGFVRFDERGTCGRRLRLLRVTKRGYGRVTKRERKKKA